MKTILCILLSAVIASIPMTSQSTELITINPLTQSIELPSSIPQDVQDQIRVVIASQEGMFSWVEGFVALAIVVVAGVILYCLWRCSQMIPDPQPQPPPDDPALVNMPSAVIYNLSTPDACQIQYCHFLNDGSEWFTICTLSPSGNGIPLDLSVPKSDRMFFRLITNP